MIKVVTGGYGNLEYDVRGIAMSFYPGEDIVFVRQNDEIQENGASQKAAAPQEVTLKQGAGIPQENAVSVQGGASETQQAVHILDLEKIFEEVCGGQKPNDSKNSNPKEAITKNDLRKKLYRHLEKETGRTLPWGILIGIRPTKLTRQFIETKMCQSETSLLTQTETSPLLNDAEPNDALIPSDLIVQAAKWMQEEYLVSPEKSVLASVIAAREMQVLYKKEVAAREMQVLCKKEVVAREMQVPGESKENVRIEAAQENICAKARAQGGAGFSLYVGIPFCPSRCSYCSFASQPASLWEGRMNEYTDALIKELEAVREMMARDAEATATCKSIAAATRQSNPATATCNSIYIGGGTPTTLPDEEFERLLKKVRELFAPRTQAGAASNNESSNARLGAASNNAATNCAIEFTVEAGRPDTITKEKLAIMKRQGVNRISINPQSMNEKTLEAIGRNHKVEDIIEAFNMAREAGFDNINMDIILGLPGENAEDVKTTLTEIKKLKPDSLTVHALAVKRAARLNLESEHAVMPGRGEEESKKMMDSSSAAAAEMGLSPYYMYRQKNMAGNLENVGYARPGKECYYNIAMMEETESIIACGAGTVSKCVLPPNLAVGPQSHAAQPAAQPAQPAQPAAQPAAQPITRCDTHKDPKLYIEQIDEMIARKRRLFS